MVSLKSWLIKNNINFMLVTENPEVNPEGFYKTCEGVDRIVVVGGMGTLGLIINITRGLNVPYGILPVSDRNDFAEILGFKGLDDDDELFEALVMPGKTKEIDLWSVNGTKVFVSAFIMGTSAVAGKYDNEGDDPDLIKDIKDTRGSPLYKVKSDKGTLNLYMSMVSVLNTPTIGGGMLVDANAKPDDGFLNAVCVKRPTFIRSIFNKNSFDESGLYTQSNVEVMKTLKMSVNCEREVVCLMDGVVCKYKTVEICKAGTVRFACR